MSHSGWDVQYTACPAEWQVDTDESGLTSVSGNVAGFESILRVGGPTH